MGAYLHIDTRVYNITKSTQFMPSYGKFTAPKSEKCWSELLLVLIMDPIESPNSRNYYCTEKIIV